jgi:hypothetical protein
MFQGRFKAVLVDLDAYLLEVCRYVELNPAHARMLSRPEGSAAGGTACASRSSWATMPS